MGEALTADALLTRHAAAWEAATVHPFLAGVRDGSVPADSFDRWLAQDYRFAQALVRAESRIAAGAPSPTSACSPGAWSPSLGSSAGLRMWRLGAAWPSTPRRIRRIGRTANFLLALTYAAYPAQITAIWALERTYLESWEGARPGAQPYREFVERWTTDEFRSYVGDLQAAVDRQLEAPVGEQAREAEDAFVWVTHYERGFWDMAMSG